MAHGTAFKGDILPEREGSSLLPARRCQGHHRAHTHARTHACTRKALKHGVGGGEWEGAGGTCTRAERGGSRVWSNLPTSSTPSSPVFLPGVKASIRFLPVANHTHTHSQQPRQCTFILACPCSPSQHPLDFGDIGPSEYDTSPAQVMLLVLRDQLCSCPNRSSKTPLSQGGKEHHLQVQG